LKKNQVMDENNKLDLKILEKIIIGRVEPHIYAFTTQTIPNYLKVGDTYRPVETRLNEWRKHFPELQKKFQEVAKLDEKTFFRDYSIHKYLENEIQKSRLLPNTLESIPYYSNEFFKDVTPDELNNAVSDIKASHKNNDTKYQLYKFEDSHVPIVHTYNRTETYAPRPNQQETIKSFRQALNKGRSNLLMYAVMRFGKSFTSMCCAVEMKAKIVLIVSAKADVKGEWKKTVESHIKFDGFSFLDSNSLLESDTIIKDKIETNEKIALFLTLQDLQGDEIKTKHKQVFENQIDLLLVDETHFGARALEYGKVLKELKSKRELKSETKLNDKTLDDLEETTKSIKSKIRIHLSGTPYRILMNSEFTTDDIIAFYQFTNIADDQEKWNEEYLTKDETKEWENPYYGFPQMIRFAFNPNESSRQKMEELKKRGITYTFSELFRPKSILKDTENQLHKKFVHEQEIIDLLNVIDGTKNDNNLLSFLDYDKLKEGKMCRHMVCVLPYRASCDAFENLIKSNEFKNLSSYEVINISGVENEKIFKDTQSVKSKIEHCESENKKTITLTVNRMLTGSTVPQWDTMLYLKDTASPQEYDQAIFRLQSQYLKTYKEPNGDSVKYNMKPQTLLVDFNPNRMFQMQEHKSQIYNVNTELNGNSRLVERIEKELQVSPIIVINNKKMVQVEPTEILNAVREYSSERSVLDEATSISIDFSLLDIEEIKAVIDKQGKIGSRQGIEIQPSEGDGDDLDTGDKPDEDNNPEKGDKETDTSKDDKVDYKGKFAMFYARILFFSFLTDSKVKSLEKIIEVITDVQENLRIASNLNLEIEILSLFQKHINPFVLSELDYKIQNINSLANDTNISPIERASNAMKRFSRLSDSEIVTPEIITEKIIKTLPEKNINESTLLLDIASKQGEFVYAVYKKFDKKIANNFYSIPTSKIAYEFTRKVYTLLELDIENIESEHTSYDLISENDLIENETIKINNNNMKFNAIVGNPPYQKSISTNKDNSALSKQIFPYFIRLCIELNPQHLSLITPSRWFTGDAQDKSFLKLREFIQDHNSIKEIHNYNDASKVFNGVEIKGGVNHFLYQRGFSGEMTFYNYKDNVVTQNRRPLFIDGFNVVLSNDIYIKTIKKITSIDFKSLTEITTGRNAFGIIGKPSFLEQVSVTEYSQNLSTLICKNGITRYIDSDIVQKNRDIFENYKVFISKSAGAPRSDKNIIGKAFLGGPLVACTDTYFPVGSFKDEIQAQNLKKYFHTKFLRYLVSILKSSQNVTQIVYKFVPLQDFTSKSDIHWTKSIEDIDKQLYKKYKLSKEEIEFIEKMIKPM
tara:strand:- start:456 stop:4415 length:3960 start_codon:yes stop_codon:yes gene_type:complete